MDGVPGVSNPVEWRGSRNLGEWFEETRPEAEAGASLGLSQSSRFFGFVHNPSYPLSSRVLPFSPLSSMRRSACPSVVWKKKKLADGSALACDASGHPLPEDKVNHLDVYKEKENVPAEEVLVDELGPRRTRTEAKQVKKNFAFNDPNNAPLCFAVQFVNLNRTAKKNLSGYGTLPILFHAFHSHIPTQYPHWKPKCATHVSPKLPAPI